MTTTTDLKAWLARVPQTKAFPPDFTETLRGGATFFTLEMTTAPHCLPCDDLWARLLRFARLYGWEVRVIPRTEAMMRSGRLGLPWIGHPVLWIRPRSDENRTVPVAVGTDHDVNLQRNIYLGVTMLSGVRPAVGLRAMSKFTGIVGAQR